MINIFYAYGLIWIVILWLYLLGWSDLCIKLDNGLIFFIIFSSITSIWIGYLMRKKMKFFKLEKNPHKSCKATIFLVCICIIDFLYARKIPILQVIRGESYRSGGFSGIPTIHMMISAFAIFYSIYLAYIFICFKKKSYLIEYFVVISFFILLMQRQNIFICIILFLNIWFLNSLNQNYEKIKNKKYLYIIIASILLIVILYGFGIFGNIRYGDIFDKDDYSMISSLGKMNEHYPNWLPKEFFWSYTYLVSPLVNLNFNVINISNADNFSYFLMEFVPEFITNNLFSFYQKESVLLPVKSLTASTAYVRVYNYFGYFGMYLLYFVQLIISIWGINLTYKMRKEYFVVVANCLLYFFIFSFFTNTIVYSTTALVAIYSIMTNIKIKNFKE